MQKSGAGVGSEGAGSRIAVEAQRSPEWRPWLALLELTIAELGNGAWQAVHVRRKGRPSAGEPLLHGAEIVVDRRDTTAWVRRLIDRVLAGSPEASDRMEPWRADDERVIRPFSAVLRHDRAALHAALHQTDIGEDAAAAIAAGLHLAVMPLLHACRERLSGAVAPGWIHGYCPFCAEWPILAELRGLDRTRHMRCGRCGGDWSLPVLHCPFCDENRHDQLVSLTVENGDGRARIDACRTCNGYVKTHNTLAALAPATLLLDDIESIAFDVAARERGFSRPERPARSIDVSIVDRRTQRLPEVLA